MNQPKNYQSSDYKKQSAEFERQHPQLHFGVVCQTCGRVVTQDEYSKGWTDCHEDAVVAEEFYQ